MQKIIVLLLLAFSFGCKKNVQNKSPIPQSAEELIARSIRYHDPKENWQSFQQVLVFKTDSNKKEVLIDNINGKVVFTEQKGDSLYELGSESGNSFEKINNQQIDWSDTTIVVSTWKDSGEFWSNFFTYLYGLPMKLKDEGVVIYDSVLTGTLDGKPYYKVKAQYEKENSQEIWYYYFNQDNNALEAYEFYFGVDEKEGEFVRCEEELELQNIKIPKIRKWYLIHEDMRFLGKDELSRGKPIAF